MESDTDDVERGRGGPLSVIIRRVVREGRNAEFEAAVRAFSPVSLTFPGHLGVHVVPPPDGGREYVVILTFATDEAWREFQRWDRYRSWLGVIRPLLTVEPEVEEINGLETWFRMPGEPGAPLPPRWKMAVATWVGVCVTVGSLGAVFKPLMAGWPWWGSLLTFNAVVVAALTWVVMPVLSRALGRWLRRRPSSPRAEGRT